MTKTKLWVVCQYREGIFPNVAWELQGVFSTLALAVKARKNDQYCILQVDLDVEFPVSAMMLQKEEGMDGCFPIKCKG